MIVPPQSYLQVIEKFRYAGSFGEFYRLYITGFHGFCSGGDCLILPTWNHLWSVAYAARRYLTSAIFPVYILLQTVIVVVAHALKPSHLYPPIEGILLVLVTAAACFLSYEVIRRVRLLRPLFGLDTETTAPRKEVGRAVVARRPAPELAVPQDIN